MAYQKPRGLHEDSYTVGEKIIDLSRQLFLLRDARVRSTLADTYYPDLFRALRVLIIDGERGRLGELAALTKKDYAVRSRRIVAFDNSQDSLATNAVTNAPLTFPGGRGLLAVFFPNLHSRWLILRGVNESSTPPVSVDFWDYLEEDVVAYKMEWGAKVTRRVLVAETCNTKGVAHATDHYSSFLRYAHALGPTAPHFLEIGQDVAYEVLTFGRIVLNECGEKYRNQIADASAWEVPIPPFFCGTCQNHLSIDELVCPRCGAAQFFPTRRYAPHEQLTSLFRCARLSRLEDGSISLRVDSSILLYRDIAEYSLVDIAENNSRMILKRTADMKLLWHVERNLSSHTALWDLGNVLEGGSIVAFLTWNPERVSIITTDHEGDLWESISDGTFQRIKDRDSRISSSSLELLGEDPL